MSAREIITRSKIINKLSLHTMPGYCDLTPVALAPMLSYPLGLLFYDNNNSTTAPRLQTTVRQLAVERFIRHTHGGG